MGCQGQAGTLGAGRRCRGRAGDPGGRQEPQGAGRGPRGQAEDARGRQGTLGTSRGCPRRAALTSALGDLQQPGAGDGDATLLLRGGCGGLLGWSMGGGPHGALRDQRLLAELCDIGTCHVGDGRSLPGPPGASWLRGWGQRDPGGTGRAAQGSAAPVPAASSPAPPAPRSPFVSVRQKRSLCRSPDKGRFVSRQEPSWHSPWSWHSRVWAPLWD